VVETVTSPRTFFISVPQLEKGVAYWLGNLNDGYFPREFFASKEMRRFIGSIARRRGQEFTRSVGTMFNEAGYSFDIEIEVTALGASKHAGLGDIDILAWQTNTGRVFAAECKRLQTALTPREVIQRLEDFRGSREQKDSLGRHLRRVDWLRANLDALAAWTKIPLEQLTLTPLLIPSEIVPMQFFEDMDFPTDHVVPFDDLPSFLSKLSA